MIIRQWVMICWMCFVACQAWMVGSCRREWLVRQEHVATQSTCVVWQSVLSQFPSSDQPLRRNMINVAIWNFWLLANISTSGNSWSFLWVKISAKKSIWTSSELLYISPKTLLWYGPGKSEERLRHEMKGRLRELGGTQKSMLVGQNLNLYCEYQSQYEVSCHNNLQRSRWVLDKLI